MAVETDLEVTSSYRTERVNLSILPTDDEIELVGQIKNLFYRARQHRRPLVSQWYRNYRVLRNRTWAAGRADWLPVPEVPEIYPIVTSMVGWMTDQRPTIEVAPYAQEGSEHYEFLSNVAHDLRTAINSAWMTNCWDTQIERMLWDAWIYGTGILKVTWDDTLDMGLGNAALARVDPFSFYPDPAASSMADANYFIEARTMSLQEMDRRWPGSVRRVTEGIKEDVDEHPNRLQQTSSVPRANTGAISPETSPRWGFPGSARVHATDDPGVTVFECWMREHEVQENDDGTLRIIDLWRVVVVAGNRILMDTYADELWEHGRHPYVRYVPHEVGEFWGFSIVEMLAPSQLAINRLLAALQLNVELVGNPVFAEGARSGLQRTRVTNRPGTRITVNENSRAEWLNPPALHPMMMQLIEWYIREMERVSGLSAITRGATPGGRNSQGVLDSVQEASFVRIRMALRNLEVALREAGNLIASLIVEYYDTPRFVAVIGLDGEKSMRALKARHFYIPSPHGSAPMKYVLSVNAGSQLSTSPSARRADAAQLLALGALDPQGVLEAYNWPNRDKILQRLNAMMAAGVFQPPGKRQRARAA
ncbi:MAG: hypothetical protein KatS3mg015_2947 [Fimbriimonadales bacterium]|nr:MAG: hypothetical protein KatS3mg015_2947 [Fimbriimonadales bacterium]